ncbi:alpha/beta hydrolase [Cyanobacterium stanieri LEGE 03274]|uniref:Alpha/beta hydrolase n=1 Tax=Cyanobacterium stanieri LEGE 03274 TaxID=1828756 RepID=A0ABR9V3M4_9CHRO|nr:alpha/beta hydrolase [Cyanobacterium stanieri]MBE9222442.1 alpha/beta hydrolase [Cyanobacterium stanieri LEGE 03274]
MSKIEIGGIEHFYQLTSPPNPDSSLPTLVFIHGWLLSNKYWQPLMDKLGGKYSCLAYDLKGFGHSQSNLDYYDGSAFSLKSYAQDLKELLTALNIQKAWLIGHSLGGSVAIWGADVCASVVEGVICVNAGGGIYLKEEFEQFRGAGEKMVKFRAPWLGYVPLLDLVFARMMVKKPLPRKWGKERLNDFLQAKEQAAIASLLESTTEEQVHYLPQIVARLAQPLHFIAGKQDKIMETKYVKHLASFHELFKNHHDNVCEIDNCGHFAMLEQTDLVYEQILTIVQKYEHN